MDLHEQLQKKRMELAAAIFSTQRYYYPLRNAKNVLRIAGELVQIASLVREQNNKKYQGAFGDE